MEDLRTNIRSIASPPRPSKGVLADTGALLAQHGPLSLRGLCANLAGRYNEADVFDAIDELKRLGLAVELSGGLYRFDAAVASEKLRKGEAEQVAAVNARIAAQRQDEAEQSRVFGRIRAEMTP